jgi:hypothetical protein
LVTPTAESAPEAVAPLAPQEPIDAIVAPTPPVAPAPTAEPEVSGTSYLDQVLGTSPRRPEVDVRAAETERAALDDDEFFATLRDAVRDDAPLGPVDGDAEREAGLRDMFKRRR